MAKHVAKPRNRRAKTAPPARAFVLQKLGALAESFDELLPRAVDDREDAVHEARVAIRRMRSLLQVFRPVLPRRSGRRLARELRALGRSLSAVRDLEVLTARASARTSGIVEPGWSDDLASELRNRHRAAHAHLTTVVSDQTTATTMHDLREFTRRSARDARGERSADGRSPIAWSSAATVLPSLVMKSAQRTLADAAWLDVAWSQGLREEALHTIRKAARKTRYAAEAAFDVAPTADAARLDALATVCHKLQDLLGDHRDELLLAREAEARAAEVGRPSSDERDPEAIRAHAKHYETVAEQGRAASESALSQFSSTLRQLAALCAEPVQGVRFGG